MALHADGKNTEHGPTPTDLFCVLKMLFAAKGVAAISKKLITNLCFDKEMKKFGCVFIGSEGTVWRNLECLR